MSTERRRQFEAEGRRAERFAAGWLRLRGYKILEQRYKTPDGEIDLIARKGKILAIIEVKQRTRAEDAVEAVTAMSEQRIMNAAERYVAANPDLLSEDFELRFDILYVIGKFQVRHEKNAFSGW